MNISAIRFSLAAAMLAGATGAFAQAQPPIKESGGVQWVCGGVSEEGRKELEDSGLAANLSLTFATAETRAYVADVRVSVFDATSKSAKLTFVADGPICLLKAPAGRYRIEAAYAGTTRSANANVSGGSSRAQPLVFTYPEDSGKKPTK